MINIVLYEPQIPQNTGNIIRLCANSGNNLHLVEPLGFNLISSKLKRSGLDYHEFTSIKVHRNWQECLNFFNSSRMFFITTKGNTRYDKVNFNINDVLIFGSETNGIPNNILNKANIKNKLVIPMIKNRRSLNLSNSVAIIIYEAWRQLNFKN